MEQAGTFNADTEVKGTSDVDMVAQTGPVGKDSEKMDVEMPMEQEEPLIDFQEGGQTDETKEKNSSKKTEGNLIDLDD
jgi:hypothetical protein